MEINFANLKKVSDKVEAILRSHPECKSDDNKLLAYFWGFEVTNKMWTLNNVSARQLLGLISRGTLTSPESIRRTRQLLQQTIPELRGDNYLVRQKVGEKVAKEINNL
jgi:hypothetical protein